MSVKILCIESSFQFCSVAVCIGQKIFSIQSDSIQNHAESLMGLIQECISQADITLNELDAVAISAGPGSYTGLRIGTSTAKGICFALSIPLIEIDTLRSIAYGVIATEKPIGGLIWPMIDARRMEVYHCVFDLNLNAKTEVTNGIIDETNFKPSIVDSTTILCGDGAEKASLILGLKKVEIFPHAKWMCKLAQSKYQNTFFVDLDSFEPFYLKFANITKSTK